MVVLLPPKIVRAVVAVVWRAVKMLGEKFLNESVRFSKEEREGFVERVCPVFQEYDEGKRRTITNRLQNCVVVRSHKKLVYNFISSI